mmetsp:Transcript_59532/g.166258  ORF Transcript_59532/g.166258 Transcript_59532/m.166258 type:complete len:265 (+) Transcript_59532:133-927(+)
MSPTRRVRPRRTWMRTTWSIHWRNCDWRQTSAHLRSRRRWLGSRSKSNCRSSMSMIGRRRSARRRICRPASAPSWSRLRKEFRGFASSIRHWRLRGHQDRPPSPRIPGPTRRTLSARMTLRPRSKSPAHPMLGGRPLVAAGRRADAPRQRRRMTPPTFHRLCLGPSRWRGDPLRGLRASVKALRVLRRGRSRSLARHRRRSQFPTRALLAAPDELDPETLEEGLAPDGLDPEALEKVLTQFFADDIASAVRGGLSGSLSTSQGD